MASGSRDRISIRIGGDAHGPVVAGRGNHVAAPSPSAEPPDGEPAAPGSTQTNTASDHATVYTVMHGELHIHRDGSPPPAAPSAGPADG